MYVKNVVVSHPEGVYTILMNPAFLSMVITWWGLQGLAKISHVWTVIMWCQSCTWSFHSGINQPWAVYRQINTSAGGQDGLADWQLILSVSKELQRNRTLPCCKNYPEDFSEWSPPPHHQKYTFAHIYQFPHWENLSSSCICHSRKTVT